MSWYTLQTQPNYENKVIEQIESRVKEKGLVQIREIFAPEEIIVDYKDGVKKERKKKLYSNYVFIEMDYNQDIHHHLKGIRGVKGFVGNKTNPSVLPDREIDIMKARISVDTPKHKVQYEINTSVKIVGGSFDGFQGVIKAVDYERNKAKVEVHIFGRETIVDMELNSLTPIKE
jgi:transcriptional antiterminator NusG